MRMSRSAGHRATLRAIVFTLAMGIVGLPIALSQALEVEARYVATTGDDTSDCASAVTPCRTLAGALAKAAPGAIVEVGAGEYPETTVVRADVTVQGAGAGATVLGPVSIWNRAVTATLADVAVAGGARPGGGGVENWGTLTLRDVVVRDNRAWVGEGYQALGGGVLNFGTLTLVDSTVRDNHAVGSGGEERSGWGGGINNRGTLTVIRSTISGNTAHMGGGIYNAGVATIHSSTISSNTAKVDGGGIATTSSGHTTLAFVTITANASDSDSDGSGDGGGLSAAGPTASSGSIVAANTDQGGESPDCSGDLQSDGHNLLGSAAGCGLVGVPGTDLTGVDASLGPLADNGGPTLTHAPTPGSPAVDAAGTQGCFEADQRGVARPQGSECDVGAVEVSSFLAIDCPCSLWDDSAEPELLEDPDREQVELGVRFETDVDGYVTAVRFFKGPGNSGTHTGSLWSSEGERLATGTFVEETAAGWQELTFPEPVPVRADTTYVASYHAPDGRYSVDEGYFADGPRRNGPLEAFADDESGGNGVYHYGESNFPTDTYRASNYWVDVRFVPSTSPPISDLGTVVD
jgi:hypothetical protein